MLLFVGTSVHAQLKVETITYTVLASAQKDSIVSDLGDTAQIKEPKYIGGHHCSSDSLMNLSNLILGKRKRPECILLTLLKTGKVSL